MGLSTTLHVHITGAPPCKSFTRSSKQTTSGPWIHPQGAERAKRCIARRWGFSWSWVVHNGKSHENMDGNWGFPIVIGKPPYLDLSIQNIWKLYNCCMVNRWNWERVPGVVRTILYKLGIIVMYHKSCFESLWTRSKWCLWLYTAVRSRIAPSEFEERGEQPRWDHPLCGAKSGRKGWKSWKSVLLETV